MNDYFEMVRDLAKSELREYPFGEAVDALLAIADVGVGRLPPDVHAEAARRYLRESADPLVALTAAMTALTA